MLKSGHLDLNSTQFCSDLSKEKLKQMILNQDLVSMGQVFELHRLYRIQIAMAEDIKQKGLGNHNSYVRDLTSHVNVNNQINRSMGDVRRSAPGLKQKPLDLQLSADDFIRQSSGGTFRDSLFESNNKETVTFDLNLSLNVREEHRPCLGKRTHANPPEIIDLEDPISKYSTRFGFSSGFSFRDKCNIQSFSKIESSNVSDGTSSRRPFINADQAYQKPTTRDSGFNRDFTASDKSVSRKAILFDLNKIQIEDVTDLSNALSEVVDTFSNVTAGRELRVNIDVQNNPKSGASIDRVNKPRDFNKGKIVYINLDSDSDEEHCSSGSDPKIESVGSWSKVSDGLSCQFETSQEVMAEADIETDINPFCQNLLLTSQPSDQKLSNTSQQNDGVSKLASSDESKMIDIGLDLNRPYIESKESEVNEEVKNAAELLLQISLQKPEKIVQNVFVRKECDQPQWRSDSYETMVLNTKECGPEDYCASSNAFDVDISEKKDSRSKLKRGRSRTKDFQTEVLFSLSTLARHEIREDINAFEGALRSREYKRRAKMSGVGDWSKPTRGKRSKISKRR